MITLAAMHKQFRDFMTANGYDVKKWTIDEFTDYSMTLDNIEWPITPPVKYIGFNGYGGGLDVQVWFEDVRREKFRTTSIETLGDLTKFLSRHFPSEIPSLDAMRECVITFLQKTGHGEWQHTNVGQYSTRFKIEDGVRGDDFLCIQEPYRDADGAGPRHPAAAWFLIGSDRINEYEPINTISKLENYLSRKIPRKKTQNDMEPMLQAIARIERIIQTKF